METLELRARRRRRRRPPGDRAAAPALLARPALRDLSLRRHARRLPAVAAQPARGPRRGADVRRVPLGGSAEPDVPLPELRARARAARRRRERLRFAGLVACRGYNQSAKDKERAAMLAAKLAGELGADGAIVTTDAGGNSHTDTMLTVRACERAGHPHGRDRRRDGRADRPRARGGLRSSRVGNAEELVPEWRPERVVGGDVLLDGRPAADCGPVPGAQLPGRDLPDGRPGPEGGHVVRARVTRCRAVGARIYPAATRTSGREIP